jgi:hypothetical protein
MKLPEEIRQILTQHTVDIESDGAGVIPDYELDDITAEVLGKREARIVVAELSALWEGRDE